MSHTQNKGDAYDRLAMFGYELSAPNAPAANYIAVAKSAAHLFISGQLSANQEGIIRGTLGKDMNIEQGQIAARHCALSILSQIAYSANINLNNIKKIVKITVLVNSLPSFLDHHLVANGASDLFVSVLGEKGKHARAAFGVSSLPLGAAVEIEAIIEV